MKTLREYFQKPNAFFADHLKRYSKSRRKSPIYWPLSTPSNSYTLWIYYHRLTDQTLYTCATDFVEPKIVDVEKDLKATWQKLDIPFGPTGWRRNVKPTNPSPSPTTAKNLYIAPPATAKKSRKKAPGPKE